MATFVSGPKALAATVILRLLSVFAGKLLIEIGYDSPCRVPRATVAPEAPATVISEDLNCASRIVVVVFSQ